MAQAMLAARRQDFDGIRSVLALKLRGVTQAEDQS